MKGSGAIVIATDTEVIKLGPRCEEQGRWLQSLGPGPWAEVLEVGNGWYRMPRYRGHNGVTYTQVMDALELVWAKEPGPWAGWDSSIEYARERGGDRLATALREVRHRAPCSEGWVRIWGDATTENAVLDGDGRVILIDPLPVEIQPRVPPIMATDLGKLMQSALGWNVAKRWGQECGVHRTTADWLLEEITERYGDGVADDVLVLCAFAVVRLVPYFGRGRWTEEALAWCGFA